MERKQVIRVYGHKFVPHGNEEMICWSCGFVIWIVTADHEGKSAIESLGGGTCPERWHGKHGVIPLDESAALAPTGEKE